MSDLLTPAYARNMRIISHTNQGGGRADGVQIMIHRGHACVGHIFSTGLSVIDARDPTKPRPVACVSSPPNTWSIHLQQHDDLPLVIHAKDMFAQPELGDEKRFGASETGRAA